MVEKTTTHVSIAHGMLTRTFGRELLQRLALTTVSIRVKMKIIPKICRGIVLEKALRSLKRV
ncbi:hypothetical protein D3C81_1317740 [compost metagenome]